MKIMYKSKGRLTAIAMIFLVLATNAIAQTTITLDDGPDHYPLIIQQMDYLVDTTHQMDMADVLDPQMQSRFRRVVRADVMDDHLKDYLWMRLVVRNNRSNPNQNWYFESWGFDIESLTFYLQDANGQYYGQKMGYSTNFGNRPIYHKNLDVMLALSPGETKVFYIKIKRDYPQQFSFHLRTNEAFLFHALNEYLFLGIYYGALLIVLLFNIYLAIKLRDKLYVYFSLLILSSIWYSFGRDGLGFQYLWPNVPTLNYLANFKVAELLLVAATLAFTSIFINKAGDYPKIQLITRLAIGIKAVISIYEIWAQPIPSHIAFWLSVFILGVPFIMGIVAQTRKQQFSWPYTIAFGCMFLSFLQAYTSDIQLIANPVVNWYIFNTGILFEVVFFSVSITSQIAYLQKRNALAQKEKIVILEENNRIKDELNNKLEEKVLERTAEVARMAEDLAQKNIELKTKNLQLKELNNQVVDMNTLLSQDNEKLQVDIQEVSRARVLMKGVGFEDFKKIFSNKEECLKFLAEQKWQNNFKCKKCGYNKYSNGRIAYGKRCKNCNYDESPTTDTLFHKLKFPIEKAFYMVYLIHRKDAELTLNELSEILNLRRETCWAFKQKVLIAIDKSGHHKDLKGWEALTMVNLD